jgi:hypothetical protein
MTFCAQDKKANGASLKNICKEAQNEILSLFLQHLITHLASVTNAALFRGLTKSVRIGRPAS